MVYTSEFLPAVMLRQRGRGSAAHYKCPWVNSALRPPSIRCQALSQIHDNTVDTNIHCSRRGMNLKTAKQAHEKSSDLTHDRCFLGSYDRCASANLTCVDCTATVPIPKHDLVLLLCSHLRRSPPMMTFCLVVFTYSVSNCKHAPSLPWLRCAVLCF